MSSVDVLANAIIPQEIRNGIIVIKMVLFLPKMWRLNAENGVKNILTKATDVAIQDPSSLVVGMIESGDCIMDRIGDVHPVFIPV